MYESITVVKVRKPTTVKVPAGGWVLLFNPDQPLHEHLAARTALIKDGNVNEEFETLLVGRLQESSTPVKFVTEAGAAELQKLQKATAASFTKSNNDAKSRQKKQETDALAVQQRDHEARVAEINEQHAEIHSHREKSTAPAQTLEMEPTADEAPSAVNEFNREELNTKDQGKLLALANDLVTAGRIETPAKTSKTALIEAILAAKPIAPAATETI